VQVSNWDAFSTDTLKKSRGSHFRAGRWVLASRVLMLALVLVYLGYALYEKEDSLASLADQWIRLGKKGFFWYGTLPLLGLLGLLNWSIEARKWQLLAAKVERIRWTEAFMGVLAGLSLGFVTPNTMGDYAARLWMLRNRQRMEAIGAIMLGRLAQFYVTLVNGLLALLYVSSQRGILPHLQVPASIALTLLLVSGLYVVMNRQFIHRLERFRLTRPLARYFRVLTLYRPIEVFGVLGLSWLRYGIFSTQFLILLWVFGVRLPLSDLFSGVSLVYLAKSVVPAFHFLSDLGIREISALYIFGFFQAPASAVLAATLSLWLLNILLPALSGSALVWRLKAFKGEERVG